MKRPSVLVAFCLLMMASCQKNVEQLDTAFSEQSADASAQTPITGKWKQFAPRLRTAESKLRKTDEYYKVFFNNMAADVEPSECSETKVESLITNYLSEFEFWDFVLYPDFASINQLAASIDKSKQYFGERGEYTHLVNKEQKKLESFWGMPGMIRINGQHNATLTNRDKIAQVFIMFTAASSEDGYYIADQVISMGRDSKVLLKTPLLSFDAFATADKLIVVGDGLVKTLAATGVVDDIAIGGILAHEWAHQVQFMNCKKWYGFEAANRPETPALTRQLEMEADFLSSYFLTHKRGATFNWKRVVEFNELFFNMGDCAFTSSGHHGTPQQRLNASKLGYKVAAETMPKGHILSADALHKIFMQSFSKLL